MSNSLRSHGLQSTRLLRPWDFPGKSTGGGCHFLLQRVFLTQGSNPGLLYCRQILYHLSLCLQLFLLYHYLSRSVWNSIRHMLELFLLYMGLDLFKIFSSFLKIHFLMSVLMTAMATHTPFFKKIQFVSQTVVYLCCCMQTFSSCSEQRLLSSCGIQGFHCSGFSYCGAQALGTQASVVAARGLNSSLVLECRLGSCGAWAQLFHSMWDLPGPGTDSESLALQGGFLTTGPPVVLKFFNRFFLICLSIH